MLSAMRQFHGSSMIQGACVLVSILGLFLQGSSGGHMLLVEHSRCLEHGELIHGGEAHEHGIADQKRPESWAVHGTPDTGSDETHDHCSLFADRRDALAGIAFVDAGIRTTETSARCVLRSAAIIPSPPRFRTAPKTSPPA